ncbi:ASCH domain-containing protein [Phytobacter sp. MRY16-398]|uniref:hypothetical protein n=1 Tax=Phytobacter sp. MRY16-398 TaxID=2487150 RepID=UPI000DF5E653|nr:hypothetical protein [Phytobacter sp. MRY16-398]BBE77397.1 hypothetical protein MRY16398_24530 [Phytobacter sp. MRY16-398]
MKERGMIFNSEMVRAILDGRKTQTRRIVKSDCMDIGEKDDGTLWPWREHDNGGDYWYPCPFGAVGDRIWVRETWAEAGASAPELKLYRANYPEHVPSHYENVPPVDEIRWTPSIHMPRWASRITLEITGVRVERLNAISEEDAMSEGVGHLYKYDESKPIPKGAKRRFAELWQSIYGEESWQANPWVWVITFKRVEGGAA